MVCGGAPAPVPTGAFWPACELLEEDEEDDEDEEEEELPPPQNAPVGPVLGLLLPLAQLLLESESVDEAEALDSSESIKSLPGLSYLSSLSGSPGLCGIGRFTLFCGITSKKSGSCPGNGLYSPDINGDESIPELPLGDHARLKTGTSLNLELTPWPSIALSSEGGRSISPALCRLRSTGREPLDRVTVRTSGAGSDRSSAGISNKSLVSSSSGGGGGGGGGGGVNVTL
jgi:hypothetical protein